MKPHKHRELIKLWADGAEIEIKDKATGRWGAISIGGEWYEEDEYRIKLDDVSYTHPVKELTLPTTTTNSNSYHRKEPTDEDLKRAVQMLEIASEYIRKTDPYGEMFYDDVSCDGGCIADDCESIAELLRKAQENEID